MSAPRTITQMAKAKYRTFCFRAPFEYQSRWPFRTVRK